MKGYFVARKRDMDSVEYIRERLLKEGIAECIKVGSEFGDPILKANGSDSVSLL